MDLITSARLNLLLEQLMSTFHNLNHFTSIKYLQLISTGNKCPQTINSTWLIANMGEGWELDSDKGPLCGDGEWITHSCVWATGGCLRPLLRLGGRLAKDKGSSHYGPTSYRKSQKDLEMRRTQGYRKAKVKRAEGIRTEDRYQRSFLENSLLNAFQRGAHKR